MRLEARGWGWRHGTRKAWAVRGLDLSVEPGERVLLLGPSGAGKSTLLAGLAGLLDPEETGGDEEGSLSLGGEITRRARREGVRKGRAATGLLLQDPLAQTVLARCGDDVAFGLENHAVPAGEIWPRVDEALAAVGFPYGRAHPTAELSGGQRQRLALAGVLALRPDWLLLDEPTAMLDPEGADQVRASIAAALARSGAGCVLVEHRVGPWLGLIDRVVVLEPGGGVRASGTPDEVFAAEGEQLAAGGVWVPGRNPRLPTPERSAGPDLLVARNLAARRPRAQEPAVRDVDLTVTAGRSIALTGPNGAGKSTLALTLAGLLKPAAGELKATPDLARGLRGEPVTWRAGELARRIGTVFQEPQHQFVHQTVEAEVPSGELLERLRLTHLARANPFTLSGGEQRRLSVATVLVKAPRVLVLDEPTFGQDARTWAELTALLLELRAEGTALVVASHDEDLVEALNGEVLDL